MKKSNESHTTTKIDAEAERGLWRLKHALDAPPDGNCFIFSALAHVEPGKTPQQLTAAAEEVRAAVQLPRHRYAGFDAMLAVAAHLQVWVARIMMIPGEPIWGVTLTPLPPGTQDDQHLYALVRQVANNHACPFGAKRVLLTWEELQDAADLWGMLITAYSQATYPADVPLRGSDEAARRAAWRRQRQERAAKLHAEREARRETERQITEARQRQQEAREIQAVMTHIVERVSVGVVVKKRVTFSDQQPDVRLVASDPMAAHRRSDLAARRESHKARLRARWQRKLPNRQLQTEEDWVEQEWHSKVRAEESAWRAEQSVRLDQQVQHLERTMPTPISVDEPKPKRHKRVEPSQARAVQSNRAAIELVRGEEYRAVCADGLQRAADTTGSMGCAGTAHQSAGGQHTNPAAV
eukprot:COSAG02_NODE_139_length_34376_cov_233.853663_14_plen_410_part_00